MSRLRRQFLYNRYDFVTVKSAAETCHLRPAALLPARAKLESPDRERLAIYLARVLRKHGFALTPWVFLPDHRHAIIYLPYPLTISTMFNAV